MCGIAGIIKRSDEHVSPEELDAFAASLSHRGPDGTGVYAHANVGLVNTRLAIVDINNGSQPFVSEDGRYVLIQNGEIYNYAELRLELAAQGYEFKSTCDTEVLLRLVERDEAQGRPSMEFLDRLNGMFAIAIYDKRDRSVRIARDRLGVKPLYYHRKGSAICFASEIKALVKRRSGVVIDFEVLDKLLTLNYVPPGRSLFNGIEELLPGSYMTIRDGSISYQRWWDACVRCEDLTISTVEMCSRLEGILTDATKLRMRCDVSYGAFLSGGVDSSAIVAMMASNAGEPIRTYSIGFKDKKYDESEYAEEVSKMYNTNHKKRVLDETLVDIWKDTIKRIDQPHGDFSFVATGELARLASEDVKVVLTGDGSDELFGGYTKYLRLTEAATSLTTQAPGQANAIFDEYLESLQYFSADERSKLYDGMQGWSDRARRVSEILETYTSRHAEENDLLDRALLLDIETLLPNNNLVKPDRMGMAYGVEARSPFLDYRVVEFALGLWSGFKVRKGCTKWVAKETVRSLIGDKHAYRNKQMFTVPVGEWIKRRVDWVKEKILSEKFIDITRLNESYIQILVDEHMAGTKNHTSKLRLLIALALWVEVYI